MKEIERERTQLQLLIGNRESPQAGDQTEGNTGSKDERFKTGGDGEFAVDPTHREYRKVE